MEKLVCKICGKEFEYEKLRYCRAQLNKHLKMEHNLTVEDYLVEYELNGIHPKCLCGCGENVTLNKNWTWHKYAKDSHVGRAFTQEAERVKKEMIESRKVVFDAKEYYKNKYDINLARESASDFLSRKYTLSDLSDKYKLDKRTLRKMWIELDLISGEEYSKITSYLKYNLSQNIRFENKLDNDNCYYYVYNLIKNNPQKYNIYNAIKDYNSKNEYKIINHPFIFYCQLKKMYGNEIDMLLNKGYHSKEEYDFLLVLQFYFGTNRIKLGHKISDKRYDYIYDFCIDNKLLIEYDSKGKYHNNYAKDKQKEEYATNNGFKFMRLTYEQAKNIETIKKIQECLN